jgi:hypothetical protein
VRGFCALPYSQKSDFEPEKLGLGPEDKDKALESAVAAVYVVAGNLLDDAAFLPSGEPLRCSLVRWHSCGPVVLACAV